MLLDARVLAGNAFLAGEISLLLCQVADIPVAFIKVWYLKRTWVEHRLVSASDAVDGAWRAEAGPDHPISGHKTANHRCCRPRWDVWQ